ncbi:hypothetical protein BCR39DRAFT_539023 [Naematelia encephala]|uniref:Uncharacterized protein n=1 Tax=Naematelia encephala TaxID=71784 RepID=A0A1Y2AXB4_9TREE|nr:hypothetical protein BCR39DRAFT_539023 [Naematelia encephala]
MSDFLNQAKAAATSALNTASDLASQAATQASALASQAANSQAAATATEQAKHLGAQAYTAAGNLAGQAHAGAHNLAPTVIPAPAEGVDKSHTLEPSSPVETAKFEKLFQARPDHTKLQEEGILKGPPGDQLAGKRAELLESMKKDKLDKDIAQRPQPEELVKKGILSPDDAPPA